MNEATVGIQFNGTSVPMPIEFVPAVVALSKALRANAQAVAANAEAIASVARRLEGAPGITNSTIEGCQITMQPDAKPTVRPVRKKSATRKLRAS